MKTVTMSQLFRKAGVRKIHQRQLSYTKSCVLVILQAVCSQCLEK